MKKYLFLLVVVFLSCSAVKQEKVLGIRYKDCISGYEIDTENGYRCYRQGGWVQSLNLKEGDFIPVFPNEKLK